MCVNAGPVRSVDPDQCRVRRFDRPIPDEDSNKLLSRRRHLMQRRVKVHGRTCWVTVHEYSDTIRMKPVWYVMAEYRGEEIFVGAPTEREALKRWTEAAEAKPQDVPK